MLKTDLITPYLNPKTEEENKEEMVKVVLNNIESLDSTRRYDEYQKLSFWKKLSHSFKEQKGMFYFLCVLAFVIIASAAVSYLKFGTLSAIDQYVVLMFESAFTVFLGFLIAEFRSPSFFSKELHLKDKQQFQNNVVKLFKALSSKNFEIRTEYLEFDEKLKVIVEENEYIDGTTSVIKQSPKSITAYINTTESKDSIIRSVVALVKAAEAKFI